MLNNGEAYQPSAGEGGVPRWLGTYASTVVSNADPLGVGRLQLNVPMVLGNAVSSWAVPAAAYFQIPNVGTTLTCVFLGGDPSQPAWNGPLDLSPLVESAAPPTVTYAPSQPQDPRVGDIWYETVTIGGNPFIAAPQVWTFNAMTSTFSWVSQGGAVNQNTVTQSVISASVYEGTDFVINPSGEFHYNGPPALNNLALSIVPGGAVQDPSGNWALGGFTIYNPVFQFSPHILKGYQAIQWADGGMTVWFNPTTSMGGTVSAWVSENLIFQPSISPSQSADLLVVADTIEINGVVNISGGSPANPTLISTDTWHNVGASGQPAFGTGFGAGVGVPRYRLEPIGGGMARLDGTVVTTGVTAAGATMFTLPTGYRPTAAKRFVGVSSSSGFTTANPGATSVQITTAGVVQCVQACSASGQQIVLDGIVFPVD